MILPWKKAMDGQIARFNDIKIPWIFLKDKGHAMNIPAMKPEELQRQALKGKQVGSKRSGKRNCIYSITIWLFNRKMVI